MSLYAKGARSERELMELLAQRGFSVVRSAGSGVGYAAPDILAFRRGIAYAFECKAWAGKRIAISGEKFAQLKQWEGNTGINVLVGWRIARQGWRFFYLSELRESGENYAMQLEHALKAGKTLEEIAH
jgi:Holliday junction resolvase